jgi:hypothetical protein
MPRNLEPEPVICSAALWKEPVRELSETCATSDMVSIASCIAQAGFPDYWDHVERTFRNYLRPLQFFVTPRYEALYRELNRDQPEEEIRAGLARIRDLQGAIWGGPTPNDCINRIALPKQCGPYNTPYGCAAMFGSCVGEGMRALYTVWSSIVTANSQGVFVNLSLNRDSEWAKVISSLPDRGRIDVIAHQPGDYFLHPPAWAPPAQVHVARGGQESTVEWGRSGAGLCTPEECEIGRGPDPGLPAGHLEATGGDLAHQARSEALHLVERERGHGYGAQGKGLAGGLQQPGGGSAIATGIRVAF